MSNFCVRGVQALGASLAAIAILTFSTPLRAEVIRLNTEPPTPSPLITFSELNGNGQLINYLKPNPIYTFANVEDLGDVTVSFGSLFVGQQLGAPNNSLADTTPTGPLTLDTSGATVGVFLSEWGGDKLVLGGMNTAQNKYFTTPIAVHFSEPVGWVSFQTGVFFDANSAMVEAFDADGVSLGIWTNLGPGGIEAFHLSETSETPSISGISIYVPIEEIDCAGFAIDNLRFGAHSDPDDPGGEELPEPGSALLMVLGAIGALLGQRSRRA